MGSDRPSEVASSQPGSISVRVLGGQNVHKMVKFETEHKLPMSMPEYGIVGGYVWEQSPRPSSHHAFGFVAIPVFGNQGERCDATATTPDTRIVFSCDVR